MKLKTKEELLSALSKANKSRKEILANRAGFISVEAYKAHLEKMDDVVIGKTTAPTEKPVIHLVNILDGSTSMGGSKFDNALAGIYSEVNKLQADQEVDYKFTFVKFGSHHSIQVINSATPLKEVKKVDLYVSGTTALNQAVGETLLKLKKTKGTDRILVSIFTDGEENDSTGFFRDPKNLRNLIEECQAMGMTITFVGTQYDVKEINKNLGIDLSNTLVHDNTGAGVANSFASKLASTINYSQAVTRGVSEKELLVGFYKQTGKLL